MQAVVCHLKDPTKFWSGMKYLSSAPEHMYSWHKHRGLVPDNPAGFTPRAAEPAPGVEPSVPIRVLVADRPDTRRLLNAEELMDDCNEDSGPWECRVWKFGSDLMAYALFR